MSGELIEIISLIRLRLILQNGYQSCDSDEVRSVEQYLKITSIEFGDARKRFVSSPGVAMTGKIKRIKILLALRSHSDLSTTSNASSGVAFARQ